MENFIVEAITGKGDNTRAHSLSEAEGSFGCTQTPGITLMIYDYIYLFIYLYAYTRKPLQY